MRLILDNLDRVIAFVLGCAFTYGLVVWRKNMANGNHRSIRNFQWPKPNRAVIGWIVILGTLGLIGYQNVQVRDDMSELAQRSSDCDKEFRTALVTRSEVTASDLKLINNKVDAGAAWLGQLLQPPPDIAVFPDDSPERRQWAIGITGDYLNELARIRDAQAHNEEIRKQNPLLADPNCGR